MKSQGIRILGDDLSTITLLDILKEISYGDSFYWALLFLDGTPHVNQGKLLSKYKNR